MKTHSQVLGGTSKLSATAQLRLKSIVHCLIGFFEGGIICLPCKRVIDKLAKILPDIEGIPALDVEADTALQASENRRVTIQRAGGKGKSDYHRVHPSWIPLVNAACMQDPKKLAHVLISFQKQHANAVQVARDTSAKFDEEVKADAEKQANFMKPVLDAMVAAVSAMVLGETITMCSDSPKTA